MWAEYFVIVSVPPGKCWDFTSYSGHDHFLLHALQIMIHKSYKLEELSEELTALYNKLNTSKQTENKSLLQNMK
jgi:hypothetical protein